MKRHEFVEFVVVTKWRMNLEWVCETAWGGSVAVDLGDLCLLPKVRGIDANDRRLIACVVLVLGESRRGCKEVRKRWRQRDCSGSGFVQSGYDAAAVVGTMYGDCRCTEPILAGLVGVVESSCRCWREMKAESTEGAIEDERPWIACRPLIGSMT